MLEAGPEERAALAEHAGVLTVPKFSARIGLKKLSPTRFEIHYDLAAQVTQACVVTLEPLTAAIARNFARQLHYVPNLRRAVDEKEVIISPEEEDAPEEIDGLHYDLAGPLVEEFLLAIDPYPRAAGAQFAPSGEAGDRPESPFAALKGLKSRG
jgi:hypothetical protein